MFDDTNIGPHIAPCKFMEGIVLNGGCWVNICTIPTLDALQVSSLFAVTVAVIGTDQEIFFRDSRRTTKPHPKKTLSHI